MITIDELDNLDLELKLDQVSNSIMEYNEELKKKRVIRNNYMLHLKKRGYTYKQISEISQLSTSYCFKEILYAERLFKKYASEIANSKVTGSHPTPP